MSVKVELKKLNLEIEFSNLIKDFGNDIADDLEKTAPVDRGIYKSGFVSEVEEVKGGESFVRIFNNSKEASLSHILEFGSVEQPPQPHFRPTYEKNEKEFSKRLEKIQIKEK